MNATLRKILVAALAALMILSAVACASTGQPDTTTAAADTGTAAADTPAEETTAGYLDHVTAKYEGETLRVLYWQDRENQEYFAEALSGAEVNDAIFRRNTKVEEKLGIELEFIGTPGNSSKANDFMKFVEKSVKSGSEADAYDVISAHSRSVGLCTYNGLTTDLSGLGSIDLSKPWWPSLLTETCRVNGQIHFLSGDISTNMLYMMYSVFYNADLLESLRLEDPINNVKDNTWTLGKMFALAKDVYSDEDAEPGKTDGDRYGIVSSKLHCDALLYGSDIVGIENEDGKLVLSDTFQGERTADLLDKIAVGFAASQDGYIGSSYKNIFKNGQSLFIIDRADIAIFDLADKNFDTLSILPVPKYDLDQEGYRTAIGNPFSLYAIPTNAKNPVMSADFLEVSAAESYVEVTPMVFEISMKIRYAGGSNDAYCYDLIRAGAVYDPSRIFWKAFSTAPDTLFQNQLEKGSEGWTGAVKDQKRAIESVIQKINRAYGIK